MGIAHPERFALARYASIGYAEVVERAKPKPVVLFIRTSREVANAVQIAAAAANESVNQWCITALRATLAVMYGRRYTQPRPLRTSSAGSVEPLGSPPAQTVADPAPLEALSGAEAHDFEAPRCGKVQAPDLGSTNAAIRRLTGFPTLKNPVPQDDIDAILAEVERDLP